MHFCDFITSLYNHFPCASQGQFILEIFSALCGESDPCGTNCRSKNRYSSFLPVGLSGDDPAYRKRLFGKDKKYDGLSGPIKTHIQANKNIATFIAYCESKITTSAFQEICSKFDISASASRDNVFEAFYEQFLEFAKCKDDNADSVIQESIEKLAAAQQSAKRSADFEAGTDYGPIPDAETAEQEHQKNVFMPTINIVGGINTIIGFVENQTIDKKGAK